MIVIFFQKILYNKIIRYKGGDLMFDFMQYYKDIFINIGLLFSLGSIYILLPFKRENNTLSLRIITGILVGITGIIVMSAQFNVTEGFLLDTRSVLLSTSAAFFGWIPGVIAAVFTSVYRISQGGNGAVTGVIVIFATMIVGLLFRKYRLKNITLENPKSYLELYGLGMVTHIVMILCFYTLPLDVATFVLGIIFWPVIILFPIVTVPLAVIFLVQQRNQKTMEQIEFISNHDFLTKLFNRHYFEQIITEIDDEIHYPLSIIMGDVNGLKLINDSYGHLKGDDLLIVISRILTKCISDADYLIRWGGDEFIILCPNTTLLEANKKIIEIKNKCHETIFDEITPSISLGASVKIDDGISIDHVLNEAEELMYRNKLNEGTSVYSNFISLLENTLVERKYETEGHSRNMSQYAVLLAKKLNLDNNQLEDINIIARLHDIGKIGIDEEILLKPGPLTEHEYIKMKKHPDIGYRILDSIKELKHIAKFVLHHHERWDGTGYPMGLEGENIPLLSRITSICDAFEVMTCGRIYQEPKSIENAIEDLKQNAGTQFDPSLVDIFVSIAEQIDIKTQC